MSARPKSPPSLAKFLRRIPVDDGRPAAFVLAGHNGSGKSTLWSELLSDDLRIPLINADRLTESILPPRDRNTDRLPRWAEQLRNEDVRWQKLSQDGVRVFTDLAMDQKIPFAFETVFSDWRPQPDGTVASKIDLIHKMQEKGYFVVLLFVGLSSSELSILRVQTRIASGGHAVPMNKLIERFPRTQQAIGAASLIADMTLMFDNSRDERLAFTLARAQRKDRVDFDCRDRRYRIDKGLLGAATLWLDKVIGSWPAHSAETGSRSKSPVASKRRKHP